MAVFHYSVYSAEGHSLVLASDDGLVGAVGDDERALLVAYQHHIVVGVVVHGARLVLVVLYGTVVK